MDEVVETKTFEDKVNIVMKDGGLVPCMGKITEVFYKSGKVERKVYVSKEAAHKAVHDFNNQ